MPAMIHDIFTETLRLAIKNGASDVHFSSSMPPVLRILGQLRQVDIEPLENADLVKVFHSLLNERQKKYFQEHNSGESGHIDLFEMEWDLYTFTINPLSGLDLADTEPSPQPIDLLPDTTQDVILYLEAENSLFIIVKDQITQELIFASTVHLYNDFLTN